MSSPPKRKKLTLTLKIKNEIIQRIDDGETYNQLAREFKIGRSTIYDIYKNRHNIETAAKQTYNDQRRTLRTAEHPALEEKLYQWYLEERNLYPMSGSLIILKARTIHKEMTGNDDFLASTGWLDRFKKRRGIVLGGINKTKKDRVKVKSIDTIVKSGKNSVKSKDNDSASSSKAESPASNEQPAVAAATSEATAVSVKQERKGEQFVIRVMDKDNSQKNVFNRFTISDGHFENNIIVKEEMEERMQEQLERTETEVEIEPHEQGEEMFPQPEAILGNMDCADEIMEEKNSVIRDLNDTLRKFLTEYKTRNALMRERIDLERARLQFDMEVYRSRQMEKRVIAVNANMTAGNVNVKAANIAATRVIAVNAGVNSNAPNCVNVATAGNSASEVKIANTFCVNEPIVAKEDNAEDNVNNDDKNASTNEVIENDNT